jgi:TatD DNase family protein
MAVHDAHCHLDQLDDPGRAVERARAAGVHRILAVSEGIDSAAKVLDLKARHGPTVLAGLGIHPMFSVRLSDEEIEQGLRFIEAHLERADALGEVGLDYKHAVTDEQKAFQHALLGRLLDLAKAAEKPVNLHSRRAERATMNRAIAFTRETGLPALMHWFTSSKKLIRICAEEGVFVSAGPSVLFNDHACEVSKHIPDDLLLVETDSPVPFGGKPAEPAWVMQVAQKLAEIRGIPLADLEAQLNENFARYLRE